MKQWAAVKNGVVVHGGFDAEQDLINEYPTKFETAIENEEYVPPWYDETVEFVDVTDVDPRPITGWYLTENGQWIDGNPSLVSSRYTIPADGTTAAIITFTQEGPNSPTSVIFDVNGIEISETVSSTGTATCEVVSSNPGDVIVVLANDASVTITVEG